MSARAQAGGGAEGEADSPLSREPKGCLGSVPGPEIIHYLSLRQMLIQLSHSGALGLSIYNHNNFIVPSKMNSDVSIPFNFQTIFKFPQLFPKILF